MRVDIRPRSDACPDPAHAEDVPCAVVHVLTDNWIDRPKPHGPAVHPAMKVAAEAQVANPFYERG